MKEFNSFGSERIPGAAWRLPVYAKALLGLTLFYLVTLAERTLVPWHVSQRLITQKL